MKIKTSLIGTGTRNDPFRVLFPTYQMVHCDYDNKWAIIEIQKEDCPECVCNAETYQVSLSQPVPPIGLIRRVLSFFRLHTMTKPIIDIHDCLMPIEDMTEWYAHLDNRYKEHSGRFRHDVL